MADFHPNAERVRIEHAIGLLDQTFAEEKKTSATLAEIAECVVIRKPEVA
jgi:hypothetical protein